MSFGEDVAELIELARDPLVAKATAWPRVPLGTVADILNGFPWKSERFNKTTGVPLIRIRDVTTGETETYYDGPMTEGYWVEQGDLLVGMDGDFNVRRWRAARGLLNQRVCKITVTPDQYDTRLLEYLLPGYLRLINQATSSVTVKHLSSRTLNELPLPLPPLAEQRRIVAKLDALTARLARARAELDRVPVLAENLKNRALLDAFSGSGTADWRASQVTLRPVEPRPAQAIRAKFQSQEAVDGPYLLPAQWRWLRLPELGDLDRGKSRHRPRNDPRLFGGDHPFIQTGDVRTAGQYLTSYTETYSDFGLDQSRKWPVGTVCITIAANIAETSILGIPACFPDSVVGFTADGDKAIPEYIEYFVRTAKTDLARFAPATAQKNINLEILAAVTVPVPPLEEQREIMRRINAAFARAARLEAEAARARALLDRLESALLAKAFRGELVPQDPNDEPAETLLDRIRTQRAAAPKAKPGRKAKVAA